MKAARLAAKSDGIVIAIDKSQWYILEVELAQHSLYSHIAPQIMKFATAHEKPETRKRITEALFASIQSDPQKAAVFQTHRVDDVHKYLSDIIDSPPTIAIVIDQKTHQLDEVCKRLSFKTKSTEFRTFTRENAGINVHVHEFEPLYEKPPLPKILESMLTVLEQVYKKGKTYDEAIKIASKKLSLNENTIRAYCTRDVGLTATRFRRILQSKDKTLKLLVEKFPNHEDAARERLA